MELRDYLRILRAHWVGIVLLTLLGTAVAFGYSALQPRVYTAEATGYVTTADGGTDVGAALVGNQLAQAKVKSFVAVGSWRAVAEYAIDELGLQSSPESLVGRVDVTNPLDTTVISVNASAGTPEEARDLAEAWIRGMIIQIDDLEGDGTTGSSAVTVVAGDSARLPTSPVVAQHAPQRRSRRPHRPRARHRLRRRATRARPPPARPARHRARDRSGRRRHDSARQRPRGIAQGARVRRDAGRHRQCRRRRGTARAAHEPAVHERRRPAARDRGHQPGAR